MTIPTNAEILTLLDQLERRTADDLESEWLEFKPWEGPKDSSDIAVEYAVCFGNAEGGVIVFGVADRTRRRASAIHGAAGYNIDTWQRKIFDSTRPNILVNVEEIRVAEGTGTLLIVRIAPQSHDTAFGTVQGLYKRRVGKNCMPMDPRQFMASRVSSGAIDWSGQVAHGVSWSDLDPVEIARARNILMRIRSDSGLLKRDDEGFLVGLEAIRSGDVTNTGLLLFGREQVLIERCPQSQIHYVQLAGGTRALRNDLMRTGLLNSLEQIERIFTGPANPEQEVTIGFFKLRIPTFPIETIREAVLNAVTHRDYADPGEVLLRHLPQELVVTSPGGFMRGITVRNILRHEPVARNRTLANAFLKLGLVESAGTGRLRIFTQILEYGKRVPRYESDGSHVTLRIYDGSFDQRMAKLVAKWKQQGREIDLNALLLLVHLKEHPFIDSAAAAELFQLSREAAREVLDQLALPRTGILERKGHTKSATFHLTKSVANDLLGKAAYTRNKGLSTARFAEFVRQFVIDHDAITPQECRELLGLGESQSAKVQVSRWLKKWSSVGGFLRREGIPPRVSYKLVSTPADALQKLLAMVNKKK